MTKKSKYKIIKTINEMTPYQQAELKSAVNQNLKRVFGKKLRVSEWYYKGGYNNITYYDGYYFLKILDEKNYIFDNDAPRGGRAGDYVIVRENKGNKEAIEFVKKYLQLLEE